MGNFFSKIWAALTSPLGKKVEKTALEVGLNAVANKNPKYAGAIEVGKEVINGQG